MRRLRALSPTLDTGDAELDVLLRLGTRIVVRAGRISHDLDIRYAEHLTHA